MTVQRLLYTQEGIEETKKIWKEFAEARRMIRETQGHESEEDREMKWGWGDLER